jgi:plasmid stabilization system protein ParE
VNFRLLRSADAEAIEAAVWYDDRRAGLGDEFLTELDRTFQRLCEAPQACSQLEAYSGPHGVRRCSLKRFPYIVIFLCRPSETIVLAVSHVRRRPFFWLERLE